jgi:hypothetical protein
MEMVSARRTIAAAAAGRWRCKPKLVRKEGSRHLTTRSGRHCGQQCWGLRRQAWKVYIGLGGMEARVWVRGWDRDQGGGSGGWREIGGLGFRVTRWHFVKFCSRQARFSFWSRGLIFWPILTLDLGNESDRHRDLGFGVHIKLSSSKLGVLLLCKFSSSKLGVLLLCRFSSPL